MKKITKLSLLLITVVIAFAMLSACNSGIEVTIYFNSNGGSEVSPINTTGNTSIKIPNNPTKDGYTFEGWFWDNNTYEQPFTANSLMDAPIQSDMTVYAKWLPIKNDITITFNSNDGSAVADIVEEYETAISAPTAPQKAGYTFVNWYSNATLVDVFVFGTMPASDTTVYAKWAAVVYSISYDLDGGTNGANPASYTIETATTTLADATKENYVFVGWYQEETFDTAATDIQTGSTGNKEFFAKWAMSSTIETQGLVLSFDSVANELEVMSATATTGDIIIPAHYNEIPITKIASGAFEGTNITSVTIPESVVNIGANAFKDCVSLATINFAPEGNLYQIGQEAFSGCTSLTEVVLPKSLVLMGTKAFFGCTALTTVTVKRPVNYISDWMGTHGAPEMFVACTNLSTIYVYRQNANVPWWAENWEELLVEHPGMMDGVMVYKTHTHWSDLSDIIMANPDEVPPVQ